MTRISPIGRPLPPVTAHGASIAGTDHILQDTWGSTGSCAWVIDGATRRTDSDNDAVAAWVADLSTRIRDELEAAPFAPLTTVLERAIASADRPGPPDAPHPSGTAALARLTDTGADVLVLCDSGVLVGEELLRDDRLANLRRDLGGFATIDAARNAGGGFWVAGGQPSAAQRAVTQHLPGADRVALMTDGVADEIGRLIPTAADAWALLDPDSASDPDPTPDSDPAPDSGRVPRSGLASIAAALHELAPRITDRDGRCDDLTAVILARPSQTSAGSRS